MWVNLLQAIIQKQSSASQQLSQNYAGFLNTQNTHVNSNEERDSIQITTRKVENVDQHKLTDNSSRNKEEKSRNFEDIRKKNQASPINGFRLTEQNSQNQQYKLPTPKLINSSGVTDSKHKPDKSVEASGYDAQSIEKLSMKVNRDPNPEQVDQLSSNKKETHSVMYRKQKLKYTTEKLSNVRLKSINLANLKTRKSIKTEVGTFLNGAENDSDEERETYGSRRIGEIRHSLILESNVVSYCQSVSESKVNQNPVLEIKDSQKKHKKKHSKMVNNSKRHKTEQKQKHKELETFIKNQQQIRTQLRVVYEKKFKLQDKLKKLNRQLQKMQTEQTSRAGLNFSKIGSPQISPGYAQILKPRKYLNMDFIQKSASWRHEKQIQNSKKAIEFIEKVSKESLKRRLNYHKKVNKNIQERVRSHVCIDCSRTKCQIEAVQGEQRNQRYS